MKKRLKQEIDGMIGEGKLFDENQKNRIFRKIQVQNTVSTKPKRFSLVAMGITMAVASIFVVLLLSQISLDPNNGSSSTPEKPMINDETKEVDNTEEPDTSDESSKVETYDSVALPDHLYKIYTQYSQTHDDGLLVGLKPFDIFRLYHHARIQSDNRTVFELYYKGEEHQFFPYESFEEYEADIAKGISENEENYNQKIMTVTHFEVKVLSDEEVIVNYVDPIKEYPLSFRLVKNSKGIWKVPFMPIQ
ncbi:hypothetical protein E3U55_07905 [Filobacillus milosensis]|uniref:Uncharacterized protein n=1 Tax=Filobacillus milosensis TaxID=94137 RepID=A0A4Y8IKT0_9BACI|nr:hypothetical protein [Filobacillus milosensis]TFB21746.1 hypothetical protein E3U55_07905 [Filobacillus milosensis]